MSEHFHRSQASYRTQAVARSRALARNAARDGVLGATLGLLLVSGLIVCSLDLRQSLIDSGAPLASLADMVAAVVAQCALGAGLCGALVRKYADLD